MGGCITTPLEISRVRNKRRFVGKFSRETVDFRPHTRDIVGYGSCDPNHRGNGVKILGATRDRNRSSELTERRYTDSAISLDSEFEHIRTYKITVI